MKMKSKNLKKELIWIFKYVKDFRSILIGLVFLNAAAAVFSVASAALSKHLINTVTGILPITSLSWIIPVMAGSFVATLLISSFVSKISVKASLKLTYKMKQDIFENSLFADWQSISKYHSGDLINRMTSDVGNVVSTVVDVIPGIVSLTVRLVAALSVILYYDLTMGLIVLLVCPAAIFLVNLLGRKLREFNLKSQQALSANQSYIQESLQNIMIIKSFGLSGIFNQKLAALQKKHYDLSMEKNNFSIFLKIGFSVLYQLASYVTLGYGAYRLYTGAINFGDFTAFMALIGQIQGPIAAIVSLLPSAITSTSSAERIIELLHLKREKFSGKLQIKNSETISVTLNEVSFAYDEGKVVLDDISLSAQAGKITALIGPSGGGKTTIIRLMLGLIHPDSGTITLNGSTEASPDTRKFFSYVPQGNTLFSGTIAENLLLGNPDATITEMEKALDGACALEFVNAFPDKLQTVIGEKGSGLSEGQAQRISIARALLRKAPVILLDEVTSALDIETEKQVLTKIHTSLSGRTCIVITHRTTVFDLCDKIYRIQNKHCAPVESAEKEL